MVPCKELVGIMTGHSPFGPRYEIWHPPISILPTVMTHLPLTIESNKSIGLAAQIMIENNIRRNTSGGRWRDQGCSLKQTSSTLQGQVLPGDQGRRSNDSGPHYRRSQDDVDHTPGG